MKERIIFHVDVNNAFLSWTAVKLLNNGYKEDIRLIPSIIGGDEKERHGIVLAKSPPAKKYHIITAETIYQAKKKCPYLQIFKPDYDWYKEKSQELYQYLSNYSPVIEQYSIDECFLDMTGTKYLYKDYLKLAYYIKDDIKKKFGYTVNVGIGNNKLCAKTASDFEKPDKVHTLFKDEIVTKLWPLDVGALLMIGKKTQEALNKLNIYTVKDLAQADEKLLKRNFKNQAQYLKDAAYGIDDSKVEKNSTKNKSISVSNTLLFDTTDEKKLKDYLLTQTEEVARELRRQKQYTNTVAITYKNNKFITYSAQEKLKNPTNNTKDIYKAIIILFNKSYKKDPIRLIGVRLSNLTTSKDYQISLFEETTEIENDDNIQKTIDNINNKFGKSIIMPASLKMLKNKEEKH